MNHELLKQELIRDEGRRTHVYIDSVGLPTVGIGHLVLPGDKLNVGELVSDERIDQLFNHDLSLAIQGARDLFPGLDKHPEPVQRSIVNLTFNLGKTGLSKFKKFIAAINACDYITAGNELKTSKWFGQVKSRAVRIVAAIQTPTTEGVC